MTFLQEIEALLLELQENYAFIIPVDRMRVCLSCASDITDMEEVFYRLQSLVCENQEQLEIFRSLFAQRLLKMRPRDSGDLPENTKPGQAGESAEEKRRQAQENLDAYAGTMRKQADAAQERIVAAEAKAERLEQSKKNAQSRIDSVRQQIAKAEPLAEAKTSAATPDADFPALRKQRDAAKKALKTALDVRGTAVGALPVEGDVDKALSSPAYANAIDELCACLLKEASAARSGSDVKSFKALLNAIASLKALKIAADATVKAKDKKTYKDMVVNLST